MLVLAAGGAGRAGSAWSRGANCSWRHLQQQLSTNCYFFFNFFFFSGLGFLSKLERAERVSAQAANNPHFSKQELKVLVPTAGCHQGCASPAPRGRGQEGQDWGRFGVPGSLWSTLTTHSSVGSQMGNPAPQAPRQQEYKWGSPPIRNPLEVLPWNTENCYSWQLPHWNLPWWFLFYDDKQDSLCFESRKEKKKDKCICPSFPGLPPRACGMNEFFSLVWSYCYGMKLQVWVENHLNV